MMNKLQMEQWSLDFNGKCIKENKFQIGVLKNKRTEVKLDILSLKEAKAETIAEGIAKVLVEYNLWNEIKIIVTDTTGVNTGKKRRAVVVRLHQMVA